MSRIIINTAQGHWSQIMHHSNGVEDNELIVITGEHNDINRDFLLNLWGFSLEKVLYISYDRDRNELIQSWKNSRLVPIMSEIDNIRHLRIEDEFNTIKVHKYLKQVSPKILFLENVEISNLEETIHEMKEIIKYFHISVVINVNPKFVDPDTVLNCDKLNKIWYITNKSFYVYKSSSADGVKIPIKHWPQYNIICEDDSGDTEEVKRLRKELTKQKCYGLATEMTQDVMEKEKEKEKEQELVKTFN